VKIKIGTKDKCKMCGEDIHWDGDKWKHTGDSYRHPATPSEYGWWKKYIGIERNEKYAKIVEKRLEEMEKEKKLRIKAPLPYPVCFDGTTHKRDCMIEIYRGRESMDCAAVVYWCKECGAVVVDEEYDNRTGDAIVPMKWPKLLEGNKNET